MRHAAAIITLTAAFAIAAACCSCDSALFVQEGHASYEAVTNAAPASANR